MSANLAVATLHTVTPGNSIQTAVLNAQDQDTILIQDGVYDETVVMYGKTLIIGSEFLLDGDTLHTANTLIRSVNSRPDTQSCFVYSYGEQRSGHLVGLSLQGECGTRIAFTQNFAGAGVYFDSYGTQAAGLSVDHCYFDHCTAPYGGAAFITGQENLSYPLVSFDHCRFSDCTAELFAGAVEAGICTLQVRSCVFEHDSCGANAGAGIVIRATLTMDSCSIHDCRGWSGGLACDRCSGSITNTNFVANVSTGGRAGYAHLGVSASSLLVSRCYFGESLSGEPPVYLGGNVPFHFVGNVVESSVTVQTTGTLVTSDASNGEVAYNVIRNNDNINGGAIYAFSGARVRVHHNYFTNNTSQNPNFASVILSVTDGRPTIDSNVIVGNEGPVIDFALGYHVTLDARNNWWGHPSGPYHPTLNPTGQGDTLLSDSVLFIPWLTEPPDTNLPNSVSEDYPSRPRSWQLLAAYPNPFNSTLRITFAGFGGSDFELTLYDLLGRIVDVIYRGQITGGELSYEAPASLASGVYFVRATSGATMQSRKVIFLK
jgi:hypothetical protein